MSNAFARSSFNTSKQGSGFADLFETKQNLEAQEALVVSPEKIKQIYEKAYTDGYERGMSEGHQQALEAGRQMVETERRMLAELLVNFQQVIDRKNIETAEELLKLSLDIAKAMLRAKLDVDPKVCLPIISEAIASLSVLQAPLRLSLNPADVEVVNRYMMADLHDQGWTLIEDDSIESGGCIVQTATNTVDATNQSRWRRISEALGQYDDWQESKS